MLNLLHFRATVADILAKIDEPTTRKMGRPTTESPVSSQSTSKRAHVEGLSAAYVYLDQVPMFND